MNAPVVAELTPLSPVSSVALAVNCTLIELTGTLTAKLKVPPFSTSVPVLEPKEVAPLNTSTLVIYLDFLVTTTLTFVIV